VPPSNPSKGEKKSWAGGGRGGGNQIQTNSKD